MVIKKSDINLPVDYVCPGCGTKKPKVQFADVDCNRVWSVLCREIVKPAHRSLSGRFDRPAETCDTRIHIREDNKTPY